MNFRLKLKRPGPLVQLTVALVFLTSTLVLTADIFFNNLPKPALERERARQRLSQSLAVQIAAALSSEDPAAVRRLLPHLHRQLDDLRSIAVRRADGLMLAESGGHHVAWRDARETGDAEPDGQLRVPLLASGRTWGHVELAFRVDAGGALASWLDAPALRSLAFISLGGLVAFGLYMRRALQHLDPSSVIPDRVQHAFDVMSAGVAVLDARGRVLLVNRAFKELHRDAEAVRAGQPLSGLPWLAAALPDDTVRHPWNRAMSAKAMVNGDTLCIGLDVGRERQLIVNCAPITDPAKAVRGCLATFDDVSALHHANAALKQAMLAAEAARDEVERKNAELHRLATRDPLTGCLNRRALYEALAPLWQAAKRDGTPIACMMLDIDHFKKVNDVHGHGIGDRAIQEVARKAQDSVRAVDLVCRYGGEEFCVVLPGIAPEALAELAERLRARIHAECGPGVREVPGMVITSSVGIEPLGRELASIEEMIDHADQALYAAKRGGRNRVVSFADVVVEA